MNKNIANTNDNSQLHGYQEWYFGGELLLRANFKNRNKIGYLEDHHIKQTYFHIR
jgi:hypothetical protein